MSALYDRHLEPIAVRALEHVPALILEGARQVGKSTLALRVAAPSAVVANLDREAVRGAAAADPEGFVRQAGQGQLVIDEIQRLPELTLALKAAIDEDRRPGRFILTGSSSLLRVRGTADSLAGRVARLTLYGLSRGELTADRDDFAAAIAESLTSLVSFRSEPDRDAYADLVGAGSYPELHRLPAELRGAWIDDYTQGVIGRDLSQLRKEVNPARARAILRILAGRQSAELVKATLAAEAGIPASTVTGYVDLLHDVGLVASIPPWTPNLSRRETGRSKAVVLDSALAMRLARVTVAQLKQFEYSEAFSSFLEAFVVGELLKQRTWSRRDFELFHYRDRAGPEVDAVLEFDDGRVLGIEVKASTSFSAKQFAGLAALRERAGDRFIAGIVLNTGKTGYRYSDRLFGAPVSALWQFGRN